jgi:hypothetical protein
MCAHTYVHDQLTAYTPYACVCIDARCRSVTGAGWTVPSNERMNITGCDFDVRSELTADEFMREYMMLQKPVLIRNGMVKGRHAHIQATPVRQTARHSTRASHAEHAAVWHVPGNAQCERHSVYMHAYLCSCSERLEVAAEEVSHATQTCKVSCCRCCALALC